MGENFSVVTDAGKKVEGFSKFNHLTAATL
jgi:hypothetical protein